MAKQQNPSLPMPLRQRNGCPAKAGLLIDLILVGKKRAQSETCAKLPAERGEGDFKTPTNSKHTLPRPLRFPEH